MHILRLSDPAAPAAPSRSTQAALAAYEAPTPPLGQLDLFDLVPLVSQLLTGAALLLAHKNALENPLDMELMAQAVAELVQRRFAGFKFAELSEAIRRGAAGDYKTNPSDVLFLSLPNVNNWLYGYQAGARHEAVKHLQDAAAQARLLLPVLAVDLAGQVAGLLQMAMDGCLKPAAELDFANVLYAYLKDLGALGGVFTASDYADIKAEATEEILAAKPPAHGPDARSYRSFVEALLGDRWPAAHPLAKDANNLSRKHVLRRWLLLHAAAETDPAALVQQLAILAAQRGEKRDTNS